MSIFYLDTNIIINFFVNRQPFTKNARKLRRFAEEIVAQFYCNSHTVATTHCILKRVHPENTVREKLLQLVEFIEIQGVDSDIILKSLKSHHKDLEDAVQIFCSHQIKNLDGIITRNLRDFSTAEVNVFSPDQPYILLNQK